MSSTATAPRIPLHMISSGERAVLSSLDGGEEFRKKLLDLGLVPGRTVEIVSGSRNHPWLLKVGDARIMLGWGMISRIRVVPLSE